MRLVKLLDTIINMDLVTDMELEDDGITVYLAAQVTHVGDGLMPGGVATRTIVLGREQSEALVRWLAQPGHMEVLLD